MRITDKEFFNQRAELLAPQLLGKFLCRSIDNKIFKARIVEVEAYTGPEDTASHSSKGQTPRTKVMWEEGGSAYIYLCYGLHYLFNIVCGGKNNPEGVLIRGVDGAIGPGRLTKFLHIDKSLNGENLIESTRVWLEDGEPVTGYKRSPRIGIPYATLKDQKALLRYFI